MSTEADQAREIAKRIARRLAATTSAPPTSQPPKREVSSELAAVRAGIVQLQAKLAQLEAAVNSTPIQYQSSAAISERQPPTTHSPWLAGINSSYSHPSQERFGIEEATVSELVDFFEKEKQCTVEPGGKPCDHCALCSSRGF
jgi:hypothetical protein